MDYVFVRSRWNGIVTTANGGLESAASLSSQPAWDLHFALLRPVLVSSIVASRAARAGHALGALDLASYPFFATFHYTADELQPMFLAASYPAVFARHEQYVIPPLEELPADGKGLQAWVLHLRCRNRFFEDNVFRAETFLDGSDEIARNVTAKIASSDAGSCAPSTSPPLSPPSFWRLWSPHWPLQPACGAAGSSLFCSWSPLCALRPASRSSWC